LALRISKKLKENKMKKKRKGFTLVELLVVIAIIALLMGILMPALARVRQIAFRMVCGSNLSGIGRAMLIYANDYDNDFPRAGYSNTQWANSVLSWFATTRVGAYGNPPPQPSQATASASLYLTVKFAEVTPKSFVCKGESTRKAFKASDYRTNMEDEEAWDFGPNPIDHCSYSYHMPYNRNFLSVASSEPGMAVAADRNPWLDEDTLTDQYEWNNHSKTQGIEIIKRYQKGNSGPHQREGQNVLFMDNHVYFENVAHCGIDEDNIYTYYPPSGGPPVQRGQELTCGTYDSSVPVLAKDSLLVNECIPGGATGTTGGGPTTATGTTTGTGTTGGGP
jgi:prepilin-type N-terminal cleavage/methylation domain-containing protein